MLPWLSRTIDRLALGPAAPAPMAGADAVARRPWREPLLDAALLGFVVLGTVAWVPSVLLALESDQVAFVVAETVIYLGVVAVFVVRGVPHRPRAWATVVLQYLLSVTLLVAIGPLGAGPVGLFAFPVITAVFLGRRAAWLAVSLTTLTLLGVAAMVALGTVPWAGDAGGDPVLWVILAANFLLLDGMATVAVAGLAAGFDGSMEQARRAGGQLEDERARLAEANALLERAMDQRRHAERKHLMLGLVVEQAANPIVVTDPDGRVEYVNAAFTELTGHGALEVVGRPVVETGCLGAGTGVEEVLAALRGRRTWRGRFTATRAGGAAYDVEVVLYPLRDDSWAVTNLVVTLRDVTREKELESQLRQAQKMEAVGTLAGGIAHDFNNLLVPVIANVQLVRELVPNDDESYDLLGEALEAADRARALVRQILTFSRRSERDRHPVRLTQTLDQFHGLLRASLPPGITVQRVDELRDAVVMADPVELHQVMVNLSANAGHAMREKGGVLTMRVDEDPPWYPGDTGPTSAVRKHAPHGWAHISVADTGHGMDRRTLDRVLEPFFTTKPAGQGTGLGLSVVHGIVESLDGELRVESEPGVGTTVHVWLPRLEGGTSREPRARRGPRRGNGEHVLLVDDDEPVLRATGRLLSRLGFTVTPVRDGGAAIALYRERPHDFDIVLTDLSMPEVTGIHVAEEVERLGIGTPVVLCTGYLDALARLGAETARVAAVITKPFDAASLVSVLRRALERAA